jgi:hypothetical protein
VAAASLPSLARSTARSNTSPRGDDIRPQSASIDSRSTTVRRNAPRWPLHNGEGARHAWACDQRASHIWLRPGPFGVYLSYRKPQLLDYTLARDFIRFAVPSDARLASISFQRFCSTPYAIAHRFKSNWVVVWPTGCLPHRAVLMPRAFRLMRLELEWFQGKPLLPSSHVPRRSAGSESALNWTRCGLGSHSPCKVEGQSAAGSGGTDK